MSAFCTSGWISTGSTTTSSPTTIWTENPALKGLVEREGITILARSHDKRNVLDFNAEAHKARSGDEETIAEIIYWERPEGGKVFHTGSIATAWGLYHIKHISTLVKKVLHHYGVKRKELEQ